MDSPPRLEPCAIRHRQSSWQCPSCVQERNTSIATHIGGTLKTTGLEHGLRHAFAIRLGSRAHPSRARGSSGITRSLDVKCVMPNLSPVVSVREDALVDGVLEGQHASFALRLVANVAAPLGPTKSAWVFLLASVYDSHGWHSWVISLNLHRRHG